MSVSTSFLARLEEKILQQFRSQNVGYLLGAGTSFLGGSGYPLASALWGSIKEKIREPERNEIQTKLDSGAEGIEQALDLLDDGSPNEKPHRYLVIEAIADLFHSITPPLQIHRNFVRQLSLREEFSIPIFGLNYDELIECAADEEMVRLIDGFSGHKHPFFDSISFKERTALTHQGLRRLQADWKTGVLHLYKLHGSLGWFNLENHKPNIRHLGFDAKNPGNAKRLMIPPQHRKTTDTTAHPYSDLWLRFHQLLCHGPEMLNRLVSIGYGLRDEHVNAVINNALGRNNFTLLVFAREVTDAVFERWSVKRNVILVTERRCSLYGEIGTGHSTLWDFETLTKII